MGQNLLTPNTNATASQVSALQTSVSNLPTTTSLASQGNVAIKSRQRGVINISIGSSATVTISSVNTSKTDLRFLGATTDSSGINFIAYILLTNSSTITANRSGSATASTVVSWELTEFY